MTDTRARQNKPGTGSARRGWEFPFVARGLLIAGAGYIAAVLVLPDHDATGGYRLAGGFSVLSAIFVVALALERLLEPVRQLLGPETHAKKDELAQSSAAARTSPTPAVAGQEMAQQQAEIDTERRQTSVMMWGVASGAGFVVAALADTLFLRAIAAPGPAVSDLPPAWFDLLLTGLIIGSGTKPTHDLVSRIEKSKNAAEDKAVRGAATPG